MNKFKKFELEMCTKNDDGTSEVFYNSESEKDCLELFPKLTGKTCAEAIEESDIAGKLVGVCLHVFLNKDKEITNATLSPILEVDDYLADANHLPISIDDDLINFVKGK